MRFRRPLVLTCTLLLAGAARLPAQDAVAAIKKLGGKLTLDESKPGKPVVGVSFAYRPITNDDLAALESLPALESLDLRVTRIDDGAAARLKGLAALKVLGLAGTKVGDAGLEKLKGLTALEDLDL
ncbi:MAG TPA: hypothetical protein VFW33_16285, partial [Gemmataceae bacterium]|nr:hypothetical protein [Gemmataceae bacterium]